MNKIKKFFAAILVTVVFISGTIPVNATHMQMEQNDSVRICDKILEDYITSELSDEEFERKYSGKISIQSLPICNEYIYSEVTCLRNGEVDNEVDCSNSLKKLTIQNGKNVNENEIYILSSEVKTSENSKEDEGVHLLGTIIWMDNLGTNNVLHSVSGLRSGAYAGEGSYAFGGKNQTLKRENFTGIFYDTEFWGTESSSFHLSISTPAVSGETVSLVVNTSIFD